MKSTKTYLPILAGALAFAGLAGPAVAQTTEMNIGGSSAAKNFMTDIPLNLCDAGSSVANYPNRYVHSDGNKITWLCNRAGLPIVIRYSATGSSDGVNKLLQPASNPASNMAFLEPSNPVGCTGPTDVIRPSDGKHYNSYTGCTNSANLPVIMGAADVQGASFHQVGPTGTTVNALDDSTLNGVATAVVPFSIYVGKGVVKLDSTGNAPNGPIDGLSRLQIEAIFNRGVTDWKRLGLGTVTDAAPGTLEATSPITLCLRNAGSGTKAAFDETVMINTNETSVATGTVQFFSSTSGVIGCLAGNRRAIGYADADQLVGFQSGVNAGLAYPVRVDGGLAYDAALVGNEKRDLKCGKYAYWAAERLNRRTTSEGAAVDALAQAFVDNAGLQATIGVIPTGAFWASDEEMAVFKNQDRGPILWKTGSHPECR